MEDRDIEPTIRSDPVNASPAAPSVDGRHLSTITDSTLIHAGGSEPKRDGRPRTEMAAALPGLACGWHSDWTALHHASIYACAFSGKRRGPWS